jgi:protocatechuate 3,4-dioxygenase beta subunit
VRRLSSTLLLLLAALAAGWLLWGELEVAGVFAGRGRAGEEETPERLAREIEADLRRRARLRGLPGIETASRGEGRLVGRVECTVCAAGPLPMPSVAVQVLALERGESVQRRAVTDAAGAFAFDGLPAVGGYTLVVHHPPYREVVLHGLVVRAGETTEVGTVLLGRPTALSGDVVDAAGRPVGSATVQAFADTSRPERLDLKRGLFDLQGLVDPLAAAATGADGTFRLEDLPPGRYLLRVAAPGYATSFREGIWVTVDERAPALRVTLDEGAGFRGLVRDAEGRGVGGARVIAVATPGSRVQRLDRVETTSEPDGRYALDGLVAGSRYFLEAWAAGFAPTGRVVVPGGDETLDLVLASSGRVEGRVFDEASGRGIPGAEVALVAGGANSLSPQSAVADEEGRFAFPLVSAGPVFLFSASAAGYPAESAPTEGRREVVAGETLVVDVPLRAGAVVEGRVLDRRGTPVAHATVAFVDPQRRLEGETAVLTGTDGRYRATGLRRTRHEVRVGAPGYAPPTDQATVVLEIPADATVLRKDFELDFGGVLQGTVKDPDGALVAGARLGLHARGDRAVRDAVRDLVAVSNAAGAWRIAGVPPDVEIVVEALHDRWARGESGPVRVGAGAVVEVHVALGTGARVVGRVTDPRGRPVEAARVRWGRVPPGEEGRLGDAFRADELLGPRVARTDGDGRFVADRLEAGRHVLKVEREGYAVWYRRDLVIQEGGGDASLAVVLEPSARITGRVVSGATGAPVADAWLYARANDGEGRDEGIVRALVSSQSGPDGAYVLEGLPDGRYEVVCWLAVGFVGAVTQRDHPSVRHPDVPAQATGVDFALVAE